MSEEDCTSTVQALPRQQPALGALGMEEQDLWTRAESPRCNSPNCRPQVCSMVAYHTACDMASEELTMHGWFMQVRRVHPLEDSLYRLTFCT